MRRQDRQFDVHVVRERGGGKRVGAWVERRAKDERTLGSSRWTSPGTEARELSAGRWVGRGRLALMALRCSTKGLVRSRVAMACLAWLGGGKGGAVSCGVGWSDVMCDGYMGVPSSVERERERPTTGKTRRHGHDRRVSVMVHVVTGLRGVCVWGGEGGGGGRGRRTPTVFKSGPRWAISEPGSPPGEAPPKKEGKPSAHKDQLSSLPCPSPVLVHPDTKRWQGREWGGHRHIDVCVHRHGGPCIHRQRSRTDAIHYRDFRCPPLPYPPLPLLLATTHLTS